MSIVIAPIVVTTLVTAGIYESVHDALPTKHKLRERASWPR